MIKHAIEQGRRNHRTVLEQTYDGICRIFIKQSVKDQETKVMRQEEVLFQEEIPCHFSFSGTEPVSDSATVTAITQTMKLFLAPELIIPPGSRIEVIQNGRVESYSQSGKAAVYFSHQEIPLKIWKEYA